ncbi:MAG: hypothetical protein HFJ36_02795 [Clostridia bacterium]|nr:hypothetical protein [Clostridia bacterium]
MFRDKLNQIFKLNSEDDGGNNKKKIENLVFFVVLLIITIVIINLIWNGKKNTGKEENSSSSKQLAMSNNTTNKIDTSTTQSDDLAKQLELILSKIHGVGDVNVFVNYSQTSEVVAMYNETTKTSNTEENDTSGGIRKIQETDSQKDIIYQEQNGEKTPITQKVIQPKVEGAIITAKGAGNTEIKANIIQAVEAVTGLATHKIQVFEMN